MKVKFLKPHPAYGYFPGQSGEVNDEQAEKLIEQGFVKKASDKKAKEGDPGKVDPNKDK